MVIRTLNVKRNTTQNKNASNSARNPIVNAPSLCYYSVRSKHNAMSPSGKAADFESAIRWFESSHRS